MAGGLTTDKSRNLSFFGLSQISMLYALASGPIAGPYIQGHQYPIYMMETCTQIYILVVISAHIYVCV